MKYIIISTIMSLKRDKLPWSDEANLPLYHSIFIISQQPNIQK